jgi:hypothetical protein
MRPVTILVSTPKHQPDLSKQKPYARNRHFIRRSVFIIFLWEELSRGVFSVKVWFEVSKQDGLVIIISDIEITNVVSCDGACQNWRSPRSNRCCCVGQPHQRPCNTIYKSS